MTKPTLVFFGNERLSSGFDASQAPVLRALITAGYPIAAVVSNYEPGRSRKARPLEIAEVATAHNIPILLPRSPKEIIEELRSFQAPAAVLVAYGRIVPQSIINIFPRGIINLHPSALPKYRGPTPIEAAILNGDTTLGISLMQLAKEMDAGSVYAQQTIGITESISKQALAQQALELGANLLLKCLPAILEDGLTPTPQDHRAATYCPLIRKADGLINWQKPAAHLAREVRAYLGWPGSRTSLLGQEVTILEAEVNSTELPPGKTSTEGSQLLVGCGDSQGLAIKKLRPAGRSSMNAADFLRGLRRS